MRFPSGRGPSRQQCAGSVLMIRPAAFDYNPETALTNKMQQPADGRDSQALARAEFDGLVQVLESEGIAVCVVEDTAEPAKPDAVFPNNWVSFHEDGTVVLYPMQAETRRRERRREVVDAVVEKVGFRVSRILDLTHHEREGRFLEGTGSLILDHVERVVYASLSPRTHPAVVQEWAREMGYESCVFSAFDRAGVPLYHTNVLMCVGARMAVIGAEAIAPGDRARTLERLRAGGREVHRDRPGRDRSFRGQHAGTRDMGRGARGLPGPRDVGNRAAGLASRQFRAPVGVHGRDARGSRPHDRETRRR